MALTAKLFATVTISWFTAHNNEREVDVEVDYTFDGETLNITRCISQGEHIGLSDWDFDEAVADAIEDIAPDAYDEWLADYGEYLRDCAQDRLAA